MRMNLKWPAVVALGWGCLLAWGAQTVPNRPLPATQVELQAYQHDRPAYMLARELMGQGKYAEALPLLERVHEYHPYTTPFWESASVVLAVCYEQLGRLAEARQTFADAAQYGILATQARNESAGAWRYIRKLSEAEQRSVKKPTTVGSEKESDHARSQ